MPPPFAGIFGEVSRVPVQRRSRARAPSPWSEGSPFHRSAGRRAKAAASPCASGPGGMRRLPRVLQGIPDRAVRWPWGAGAADPAASVGGERAALAARRGLRRGPPPRRVGDCWTWSPPARPPPGAWPTPTSCSRPRPRRRGSHCPDGFAFEAVGMTSSPSSGSASDPSSWTSRAALSSWHWMLSPADTQP